MRILNAVEEVNDAQKEVLFTKVKSHFNGKLQGKNICDVGPFI